LSRSDDIYTLPKGIPAPIDDGACDHLTGMKLPSITLPSTAGAAVNLASLPGRIVVYLYPRTGRPDQEPPQGWNEIPGARGCTPESCAFRDHKVELEGLGAKVFGLSTQETDYQREAVERLHLPFELLSDEKFEFVKALSLPIFQVSGTTFVKRITLVLHEGAIEKVFYPVFPPDKNAEEVVGWLREHSVKVS